MTDETQAPWPPAEAPSAPRALSYIKSEQLRRGKRRAALRTFLVPLIGASAGLLWTAMYGVGWLEFVLFAVMFAWVTLGLEVGFHRLFAHHAFRAPQGVQGFLWASALMSGQGPGVYWTATHRRHHAFSDSENDPHTPYFRVTQQGVEKLGGLRGFWHAHQGNTYTDYATNVAAFSKDVRRNALLVKLDDYYTFFVTLGIVLPGVIGAIYYGTWQGAVSCAFWGGPIRIFVQHQLFFTNASLGHMIGERPFDTGDNSRNNWWCALWTFGSALQNTHHAFPSSAYLSYRWYEVDIAGGIITVLSSLGLATEVRRPSKANIQARLVGSRHEPGVEPAQG